MQKRDPLAFGTNARLVVDESHASLSAAFEHLFNVVYIEANMVNAGAPLSDELADRSVWGVRLQQFDEGISCSEPGNACTVGIVEWNLRHAKDVPVEWKKRLQAVDRDSDVRDARPAI